MPRSVGTTGKSFSATSSQFSRPGMSFRKVANALPMLKEHADLVTEAARGQGVIELIDRIIATDLADVTPRARAVAISSRAT